MANGPQVESFLGAIKNEKLGLTLLVRMNPDVRRQFARRVSESSSANSILMTTSGACLASVLRTGPSRRP